LFVIPVTACVNTHDAVATTLTLMLGGLYGPDEPHVALLMVPGSPFTPAKDKPMHFPAELHPANLGCTDGDEPDVREKPTHPRIGVALAYLNVSSLALRMQDVPFATEDQSYAQLERGSRVGNRRAAKEHQRSNSRIEVMQYYAFAAKFELSTC